VLTNVNLQSELSEFFYNRIENLFVEKGLSVNLVRSVLSVSFSNLVSAKEKIEALSTFVKDNKEVVDSLVASNKRIANILKKSANSGEVPINSNLFENDFESVLSDELSAVFNLDKDIPPSMLLVALSKLEKPINDFFDNVMVNAEDSNVKKNRLALLQTIRSEFLAVADFSLLQG
jgi:glycyl-tRNA synthetase beta chain